MKITVVTLVDGEELDIAIAHGYRGAGWIARRMIEDLGLIFRGTFREYKLPEGEVITFVLVVVREAEEEDDDDTGTE